VARRRRMPLEELMRELDAGRAQLFEARTRRERPATDDKILTDWNGTAITGLAVAGKLLGEPGLVQQAARAADFILGTMRPSGGPLLHAWRQGQGKIAAYLADYVFLARGLLALHEATGEARWLAAAADVTSEQLRRLRDPEGGFFTAGVSPDVLFRSKDVFDGAMPAANAVAVLNLIDLGRRTGDLGWRGEARTALSAFTELVQNHPEGVRMLALAVRRYHETGGGPEEANAEYGEFRAAHEREASAGTVAMLEHEAEKLVRPRLTLGDAADGWRPFRLILEIAPGWHLQANPASEPYLVATEVKAEKGDLRNLRYAAGESFSSRYSREPISVYSGRVEITGEISEGGRLMLRYQACDEGRCLPPVERGV
jgi:uncharacterized protein